MIRLELPNVNYKKSYIEAAKEFINSNYRDDSTRHYSKDYAILDGNFEKYVQIKIDNHNNIQKEGWVQCTDFFIIDENDEYCGRLSLRHRLNEKLEKYGGHIGYDIRPSMRRKGYATNVLKLGLEEAKKLGLKKVLLTCDDDNMPSIKTIEKNNGVLQDKIIQDDGLITRRYWIDLK